MILGSGSCVCVLLEFCYLFAFVFFYTITFPYSPYKCTNELFDLNMHEIMYTIVFHNGKRYGNGEESIEIYKHSPYFDIKEFIQFSVDRINQFMAQC